MRKYLRIRKCIFHEIPIILQIIYTYLSNMKTKKFYTKLNRMKILDTAALLTL